MLNNKITYQTLSQYLSEVRDIFQEWADYRWIVGEIARVDTDKNGNYWFELVEKRDEEVIAQCGAVLWKSSIETVQNFFLKTGMSVQKGMKILFLGKATFHERYGFKISIFQIDPSYTLGEMALKKKEVLERLTKEGLIDKNKAFPLPLVIQKIAVISSESAAGYEDFIKILRENKYGFSFSIKLYDAFVQGQEAVFSIITALKKCSLEHKNFDTVVIIRGGGSVVDLQCFDEYELAKAIALMPLPVLTGIGHTRDKTVADEVAHSSFKTPSEVAKFILEQTLHFDSLIEELKKSIFQKTKFLLNMEFTKTENFQKRLPLSVHNFLQSSNSKINLMLSDTSKLVFKKLNIEKERTFRLKNQFHLKTNLKIKNEMTKINNSANKINIKSSQLLTKFNFLLKTISNSIKDRVKNSLAIKNFNLQRIQEKLHLLSPENILKRGYSITYMDGKILKDAKEVKVGSKLEIQLYKGKLISKVQKKEELNGEPKLF